MLSPSSISGATNKLYTWFYSVLLFFTPLIFASSTGELYEFPKIFFVYLLGGLILTVFVIDVLLFGRKLRMPDLPVVLFVLVAVVAAFFSMHFYTSVWGYYTRFSGGLMSIMIYFCVYLVARSVFSVDDVWYLLKFSAISSLGTSVYGISQYFTGVTRVYSTFGQPNWLAHYYVMLTPLIILMYCELKGLLNFWYFVYVAAIVCFWFTYSLSGMLSLLVGLGLLVVLLHKEESVKDLSERIVLLLVPLVASFALFPGIFGAKVNDVLFDLRRGAVLPNRGVVERVFALGKGHVGVVGQVFALDDDGHRVSDPGSIRFGLWSGTLNLIMSSPKVMAIGTGLETFPYVFQEFRPDELNYTSEWEFVFNKPHNYYLELVVEMGFIGLFAFMWWAMSLWAKVPKLLMPSFMAFLVANFFGWPAVAPSVLFWFLAGVQKKG